MELPAPIIRAWAAGVFEAKCRIYDTRNELYFDHNDEKVIQRFIDASGCGYMKIVSGRPRQLSNTYRWATKSMEDTRKALLFVLPLLGPSKAAQVSKLMSRIESNPTWQRQNGKNGKKDS